MKKCFEHSGFEKHECPNEECNNIRIMAALGFYNNEPGEGELVSVRGEKEGFTGTITAIGGRWGGYMVEVRPSSLTDTRTLRVKPCNIRPLRRKGSWKDEEVF